MFGRLPHELSCHRFFFKGRHQRYGFTNVISAQPYAIMRRFIELTTQIVWTLLRSSVAPSGGAGALGPSPQPKQVLCSSRKPADGLTRDIGWEFDVLMDSFDRPIRIVSNFGMFLPGYLYGPFQEHARKYELGIE